MYLPIPPKIHPFSNLSTCVSIYDRFYPSIHSTILSIWLSINLANCLSIFFLFSRAVKSINTSRRDNKQKNLIFNNKYQQQNNDKECLNGSFQSDIVTANYRENVHLLNHVFENLKECKYKIAFNKLSI